MSTQHVGCLYVIFSAVTNQIVTNSHVAAWVFSSFGHICRSGISGSDDAPVFTFGGIADLFSKAAAPFP